MFCADSSIKPARHSRSRMQKRKNMHGEDAEVTERLTGRQVTG